MSSNLTEEKPVAGPYLPRILGTVLILGLIIIIGKGCNGAENPDASGISKHPAKMTERIFGKA